MTDRDTVAGCVPVSPQLCSCALQPGKQATQSGMPSAGRKLTVGCHGTYVIVSLCSRDSGDVRVCFRASERGPETGAKGLPVRHL